MVNRLTWAVFCFVSACTAGPGGSSGRVSVEVVSPAPGEVYTQGEAVFLEASATELDGGVAEVDGFTWSVVDGDWLEEGNAFSVTDLPVGQITLEASASVGGRPVLDTVSITVASNQPEGACDDGQDNDGDGLSDCDDEDCADRDFCAWPTSLSHTGVFDFDASFLAELAGYPSCTVAFNAALERVRGPGECPNCDRTFGGAANYTENSCPGDSGDLPGELSYGVVFTSETEWSIWASDGSSWGESGTATGGSGSFTLYREDPVEHDGQDGGTLMTTLTFTDN
ncbi:MAG: hypothetical protein VX519_00230 [Myxococcota bacterium]|nr:hypothetical protein [Myxococcota bacterium]